MCNAAHSQPDPYEARRLQMVKHDIEARGVKDALVLKAMRKVQRHLFVEEALWPKAYNDHPLPIGDGQTISQPYVVALMTEALALARRRTCPGSGHRLGLSGSNPR